MERRSHGNDNKVRCVIITSTFDAFVSKMAEKKTALTGWPIPFDWFGEYVHGFC